MLGRAIRRVGRWTVGFTAVGFVLGLLLMFAKAPPFAESGHKPDDVMFYSFWVPICSVLGSMAGLALGTLSAIWSALMEWGDRHSASAR